MGILQSSEPVELPECLKWRYRKVGECMLRGPFMLASTPKGFETHHPVKRTLPCFKFLKGCTLECPFCRWKRQYTTYVPLLDLAEPKHFRIVVSGGKKTFEDVRNLAVGTLVGYSRGKAQRDTLRIRPWPEQSDAYDVKRWERKCIEDISPYLLHLWQIRELTEHFGQTYYPSLRIIENSTPHPNAHPELGDKIPE